MPKKGKGKWSTRHERTALSLFLSSIHPFVGWVGQFPRSTLGSLFRSSFSLEKETGGQVNQVVSKKRTGLEPRRLGSRNQAQQVFCYSWFSHKFGAPQLVFFFCCTSTVQQLQFFALEAINPETLGYTEVT
jgi:hypothetical protein